MITSIIAIIGGLIASSSLIIARKPDAREILDKLTPYQGWIGIILAFWGTWGIIQSFLNIGSIGIFWFLALVISLTEFTVGFLLGYGLISKYLLEKNETAKVSGQELRLKLAKYQIPAGVILVILGVISLLF